MVPKKESSLPRSKSKIKITCESCGTKIKRAIFQQHRKSCQKLIKQDHLRPFSCHEPNCYKAFRSANERTSHICTVHSTPITCPVRGCGFTTKKYYMPNHLKTVHENVRYSCRRCNKKFTLKSSLYNHEQLCLNDGTKAFVCLEKGCGKIFKTNGQKLSHVWGRHSDPIECPMPNCKSIISRSYLSTHIRCFHDKMKETCTNCGKQVAYGSLSIHLKRCSPNKKLKTILKIKEKGTCLKMKTLRTLDNWILRIKKP